MTTALVHEPDASRYALYIDGELAALADYSVQGDTVSFHHTFTDRSRRGQGLAGQVVEFAMNDVEATSTRAVSPDCWYVDKWFAKHPDRAYLLRVRG
ncbi:GNAT family N-acetyltransferase [Cryobacterium sp. W22_MBD10_FK3]|uniref:GNAT family N-acetyltransferase n=1 Tax=Cryobacterium sp. W22_MBD10_FK3 TaxID=3240273 RepID=UPI003F91B005